MADPVTTPAPATSGASSPTPSASGTNFGSANSPDFQTQLAGALFSQNNMVSSDSNNIDTVIQGAISGLQTSQQHTDAGLAAGLANNTAQAQRVGAGQAVAEETARRGMGVNTAIISNVSETTKNNINSLNAQYQQAISTGDAATAGKISDLQVQALTMRQKATQDAFSNMLNIAATLNSAKQTADAESKQNFDEQSQIGQIGLQYGIPVTPGMTLADMVSKAAPQASSEEKARLGLTLAQTQQAQAEAAKALAGAKAVVTPDNAGAYASVVQGLVQQGRTQEASAYLTNIMTAGGNESYNLVNKELQNQVNAQFDPNTMGKSLDSQLASGQSVQDITATITNNPFATDAQKKSALSELVDAQNRFNQKQTSSNPGGFVTAFGQSIDKNSLLGKLFQ